MSSTDDLTTFITVLGLVLLIALSIVLTLLVVALTIFLVIYIIFECVLRPFLGRCQDIDSEIGRRAHRARIVTYHAIIPENLRSPPGIFDGRELQETEEKRGLRQNAIESLLPQFLQKHSNERSIMSRECAICLCDYVTGEECRVFPICKHMYHAHCIDLWLKNHLTCPICRKDLLNS